MRYIFNLRAIILISLLFLSINNTLANSTQQESLQKDLLHNICQLTSINQKANSNSKIYIFISFSMPDAALKNYAAEAEQLGAILVMRGLKNNSFFETKAKADELAIMFNIDPNLFEKYQITSVPAIIVDNHQDQNKEQIKKLTGHIALSDALQIMKEATKEDPI